MTEQWVPETKEQLIAAIEREWNALMAVVDRLSPEQQLSPDEGGWSPKDNLAHLGEWMTLLMGHHMDKRPAHEVMGVTPEITRDWDMEVINPVLFERHKDRPFAEVMSELKQIYGKLLARLQDMSFDDLLKPRHPDDPQKRPLLLWVLGDTSEHLEEHRQTIEKML